MSATGAYRESPSSAAPVRWWHRLTCRLFGHLLTFKSVDGWLAGEVPRCPRCGAQRSVEMLSISEQVRGLQRAREQARALEDMTQRTAEDVRKLQEHGLRLWQERRGVEGAFERAMRETAPPDSLYDREGRRRGSSM